MTGMSLTSTILWSRNSERFRYIRGLHCTINTGPSMMTSRRRLLGLLDHYRRLQGKTTLPALAQAPLLEIELCTHSERQQLRAIDGQGSATMFTSC